MIDFLFPISFKSDIQQNYRKCIEYCHFLLTKLYNKDVIYLLYGLKMEVCKNKDFPIFCNH